MVTRPQIEKLSARIEALADAIDTSNDSPGVVYAWKEYDETDAQVLERIYQARPEAQRARSSYCVLMAIAILNRTSRTKLPARERGSDVCC